MHGKQKKRHGLRNDSTGEYCHIYLMTYRPQESLVMGHCETGGSCAGGIILNETPGEIQADTVEGCKGKRFYFQFLKYSLLIYGPSRGARERGGSLYSTTSLHYVFVFATFACRLLLIVSQCPDWLSLSAVRYPQTSGYEKRSGFSLSLAHASRLQSNLTICIPGKQISSEKNYNWLTSFMLGPASNISKTCLGKLATVMDAEMVGIAMVWRHHKTVAADSQGAIGRIIELQHTEAKSWIEPEVIKAQDGGPKEVT